MEKTKKKMNNPFKHDAATNLTNIEIQDYFIDNADSGLIKNNKHVIIEGHRGSGKSMLLKYHSFPLQSKVKNMNKEYIGIYVPCNTPLFSKMEYQLNSSNNYANIFAEHILVCTIAEKIVSNLIDSEIIFSESQNLRLHALFSNYFDSLDSNFTILYSLRDYLKKRLLTAQKSLNNDPELFFKESESFSSIVIPIIEILKENTQFESSHFMLFIDDAQLLQEYQQKLLNTLISYRNTNDFSFKIAITSFDDYSFKTNTNSAILENHDYIIIDLIQDQFTSRSEFDLFARKLIEKRLKLANININIDDFFPISKKFNTDLKKIHEKFILGEYPELKDRSVDTRRSRVSKYERAIYFRQKHETHKANFPSLAYTGFKVISHLSTGVIRNLLIPCYKMFETQALSNKNEKGSESVSEISIKIQYETIKKTSENIWDREVKRISRIIQDCSEEDQQMLYNFLFGFSKELKKRLMDPKNTEKQILSFTIVDLHTSSNSETIMRVLSHGIKAGLIYTRMGPDKSGGKTTWYTPNRMLWPYYGLDPVGQNGRMNIKAKNVLKMMKGNYNKNIENKDQDKLFK